MSFHPHFPLCGTLSWVLQQDRVEQEGAQDHATTGSARFQEGVPSRQKKGMRENKTEGEMLIFPPDEGGKRSSVPANERESAISGSFENHFWVFPAEGARV